MFTTRSYIVVALMVTAALAVLTLSMVTANHPGTPATADRSYDRIELARAQRYVAAINADHSYDQIEMLRAQTGAASVDRSYDQVEMERAAWYAAGASSDSSYAQIEILRAQRYTAAAVEQAYLNYRRGEWTGK